MLVKGFPHLNQDFLLASLEERGKLWKWLRVYSGVLHLAKFSLTYTLTQKKGNSRKVVFLLGKSVIELKKSHLRIQSQLH